jgi:C4-dicarboxylate-specific signal transduction histidine kinase
MQAIRLRVDVLEIRDRENRLLLSVGDALEPPAGGLAAPVDVSARHEISPGRMVVIYARQIAGSDGQIARAMFDADRLGAALAVGLPPDLPDGPRSVGLLTRLDDGRIVARSGAQLGGSDLDRRIGDATQQAMQQQDRGQLRVVSGITGMDMLVGFETLPSLGLTASSADPLERVLAVARTEAQYIDLIVLVVALTGMVVAAVTLGWLIRRGGSMALAAQAERHSAESSARGALDRLAAGSPALLYLGRIDPDGTYHRLYATRNVTTVTGWPESEMATPDQVWTHAVDEDSHIRGTNYARAVQNGRSSVDYRFRQPDGSQIWLRNQAVCLTRFPDGSAEVAGAVTNITQERELAAAASLQSRMATLGELATGLAHELTQPITVIAIAAELAREMAREGDVRPDLQRQIASILAQSSRASDIINHLRHFGHAGGGALESVDLRTAIDGAMSLAAGPLRGAHVTMTVTLPDMMPPVLGRMVQVEQVLLNLFLNARDAMMVQPADRRGITITASREPSDAGGALLLCVADTGPGIPASVMPRLFDAFFTTKKAGEGTGLGLSISRNLMRGFGGDILAESGSEGARFTLRFQAA